MQTNTNPRWIQTKRLILRPIEEQDYQDFATLDRDPEVRRFFPEGPLLIEQIRPELDRYIGEWELLGFGMFAILDKKTGKFMGRGGFAKLESGIVEMGYLFFKEYWGQGFATEAACAMLAWAKNHVPIDRIVGFAPKDHIASWKVLENCGMQYYKTDNYHNIECVFYYKALT